MKDRKAVRIMGRGKTKNGESEERGRYEKKKELKRMKREIENVGGWRERKGRERLL